MLHIALGLILPLIKTLTKSCRSASLDVPKLILLRITHSCSKRSCNRKPLSLESVVASKAFCSAISYLYIPTGMEPSSCNGLT